ncbi:MAG: response regulator transcription factor [Kineosporiaceae bacterium]|nr:response regulator transcription factor [Aeromicrobium sp.]
MRRRAGNQSCGQWWPRPRRYARKGGADRWPAEGRGSRSRRLSGPRAHTVISHDDRGGAAVTPIRVVIADDQALVRTGLRMIVDSQDDLRVVGEASDGIEALELLRATSADIVLMDVRMPRLDGVKATRQLLARPGAPQVIVLTTFDLDEHAFAALQAGASGFLLKDAPAEDLIGAIRSIHSGDAVIAPSATRRLLDHIASELSVGMTKPDRFARLTDREREVLFEVASGASNAEIAGRLFLSEATVKTHVGRVLSKLGLRDRVQAVVLAYESGLIRPGQ